MWSILTKDSLVHKDKKRLATLSIEECDTDDKLAVVCKIWIWFVNLICSVIFSYEKIFFKFSLNQFFIVQYIYIYFYINGWIFLFLTDWLTSDRKTVINFVFEYKFRESEWDIRMKCLGTSIIMVNLSKTTININVLKQSEVEVFQLQIIS